MAKKYYQYGTELGIYPVPDYGAFSIGTIKATASSLGTDCVASGAFTGVKETLYSIFIDSQGEPCSINWNDSITNPVKSIIRSSVTSNVATVYVKDHGYSTGDKIRTFGSGAYSEEKVEIESVIDENSFTYDHTTSDGSSTGGSVWKWNDSAKAIGVTTSLSYGITVTMDASLNFYHANTTFTFTVSNTTGKTVRVHYHKEPDTLALSTDTPQIKKEHHEGLVMYACKQISRRFDINRYPIYSQEWEEWYNKILSSGKYIREENVQSTFRDY